MAQKTFLIKAKIKAKIEVKKDAKPKFCKARNVPFALQGAVEKEIDRLENKGITRSVTFSEWASPIVIVPKPNGSIRLSVRIYSGLKVTR